MRDMRSCGSAFCGTKGQTDVESRKGAPAKGARSSCCRGLSHAATVSESEPAVAASSTFDSRRNQERVDRAVRSVRENGYSIVTGFLDLARTRRVREEMAAVFDLPDHLVLKGKRLPAGGGENTIHVCNLFARKRAVDGIATDPLLLKVIDGVLGPAFQLSVACAMRPGPGGVNPVLHRDDVLYGVLRPHVR